MPRLLPCQQHSPEIRKFIAQALGCDVAYLTEKKTARAVTVAFDPHTVHTRVDDGTTMDSGNWRKVFRGDHLPSAERLQRVIAVHPLADRATRLILWPAIDAAPRFAARRVDLLDLMPAEIKAVLFETDYLQGRKLIRKPKLSKWDLSKLSRIGGPDALAAQLILLSETPSRLTSTQRILVQGYAYLTLLRLMHFSPFFELGASFYDYIIEHHLGGNKGTMLFPGFNSVAERLMVGRIEIGLMQLFGFVDDSFKKQHKMLYCVEVVLGENSSEAFLPFLSNPPPELVPDDQIHDVLRRYRHPAIRNNSAIPLPYKKPRFKQVRIANALTFAALLPDSQDNGKR